MIARTHVLTLGLRVRREALQGAGLELVSRIRGPDAEYLLARAVRDPAPPAPAACLVVDVSDESTFAWVPELRAALARAETEDVRVYCVARGGAGLLGLGACLRAEPGGARLRLYLLPGGAPPFAPDAPAYRAQVRRDLAVNVLRDTLWGSYRHLDLGADDAVLQVRIPTPRSPPSHRYLVHCCCACPDEE